MRSRFSVIVLLAIFACSVLAVSFSPSVIKADGVDGPWTSDDMTSISKKYASQEAFLGCTLTSTYSVNNLSLDAVMAGKFFTNMKSFGVANEVVVGYVIDGGGDDGRVNCTGQDGNAEGQSLNWLRDLGWDDPVAAMCEMNADAGIGTVGGPQGQIETCMRDKTNDSATFRLPSHDKIQSAIASNNTGVAVNLPGGVRAGSNYSLTAPARYVTGWSALQKSCSLSGGVETAGKDKPGQTKDGNNISVDGRIVVAVVNKDSSISYVSYKYDTERTGMNIFAMQDQRNKGGGFVVNCSELAKEINDHAGAYAQYLLAYRNLVGDVGMKGGVAGTTSDSVNTPEAVCGGGALGWVLCPIVQLASGAVIELTKLIDGYMRFDPLLGTTQGDAVYNVWRIVVNIANLLLVVAFLVVIFSQATSFGLSAYGIKKMLPRIILSAILINISFYLCAILVDIFNVVGASIAGIVGSVIEAIPDDNTAVTRMGSGDFFWSSFLTWAVAVGSAALVMTFGGGLMAVLLPIIITVAASLFMLFAILALRHSIALLLIMVSPLAFAAMILPNTDGLFKKWWKALYTVLFLYPLIMLLSYGSLLVSKIMLTTIPANEVNTLAGSMGILIALLTSVAWIFALKFIVTWGSGLVGKVAGMVNDKTKGIVDRPKNWAKERGKQVKNDRRNQRMEWLQEGKAPLGFRGLQKLGRKFDPAMLKARRDGWSGVYEEQGKLAAARNSAEAIKNSPRADATQRARAQATLDELDIKRAKVKLDFEFEGNAQKAFDKALEVGDNALLKLSAGKLVDNAKLESVQQKMAENMDENQIVSLSRHLMNNHFAKVKEQDLGMMYALQELAGEVPEGDRNYATSKEGIKKLRRGGSEFDKKAMTASNVAIGSQEKYVLNRQTGTGAEYSNIPPVMEQKRALEIASDPNTRGSLKAGQLEILEQHATRPLPPP